MKQNRISNCFLKARSFKNRTNSQLPTEKEVLLPVVWEALQRNCTFEDFLQVGDAVVTAEERGVEEFDVERIAVEF
ncbi:hypothetical protein AVEN_88000-1 [Araneus ventricosus]|uniref:Uncharacterized protein n=1 Tax=Araneus ventricosus TaxID=182803 RepID=A0A4Y2G0N1_ARAVE|nr:hypothetical protein AVEN_88000-1 [Araneus ventricosus]